MGLDGRGANARTFVARYGESSSGWVFLMWAAFPHSIIASPPSLCEDGPPGLYPTVIVVVALALFIVGFREKKNPIEISTAASI